MVGFFERNPAIIWPVISAGIILCATGVFLARRHVKFFREMEQERQRAMWRPAGHQSGASSGTAEGLQGDRRAPAFDVPMFCLEAPSRPLARAAPAANEGRTASGSGRDGRASYELSYNDDLWCAIAVPLRPDDVTGGQYLDWAALTLVVQPHLKFTTSTAPAAGADGATSPGVLTKAGSGRSLGGAADGADDGERPLSAVSLTLVRTPSLGLRPSAIGTAPSGGGGSDRRYGRSSLPTRMGDLLSLFASVAVGGGGGAATATVAATFDGGAVGPEYGPGFGVPDGGDKPLVAAANPPKSPAVQEGTAARMERTDDESEAGPSQRGSRTELASSDGLSGGSSTSAYAMATATTTMYGNTSGSAAPAAADGGEGAAAAGGGGPRRRPRDDDVWIGRSRDQTSGGGEGGGGGGGGRRGRSSDREVALTVRPPPDDAV